MISPAGRPFHFHRSLTPRQPRSVRPCRRPARLVVRCRDHVAIGILNERKFCLGLCNRAVLGGDFSQRFLAGRIDRSALGNSLIEGQECRGSEGRISAADRAHGKRGRWVAGEPTIAATTDAAGTCTASAASLGNRGRGTAHSRTPSLGVRRERRQKNKCHNSDKLFHDLPLIYRPRRSSLLWWQLPCQTHR
jgi:hypothetical protein